MPACADHAFADETRGEAPAAGSAAIVELLSSVRLVGRHYDFDHNGDGVVDLTVHPVVARVGGPQVAFATLPEAIDGRLVTLREDPKNYRRPGGDPKVRTSVVAASAGNTPTYYQSGSTLSGGGQGRGFGRSGTVGRGSGTRGYGARSSGRSHRSVGAAVRSRGTVHLARDEADVLTLDALCFEKGRLIPDSMKKGASETFAYTGMASPSVRKQLVLAPRQDKVDLIIAKELKALGVVSRTGDMNAAFDHPGVAAIVDYYLNSSRHVLSENAAACGMVVARGDGRVLCADVYASRDLFAKMFPHLMQSAALEVCHQGRRPRSRGSRGGVEEFLDALKQIQQWEERSPQTHALVSRRLLGQATFYVDGKQTYLVHLEAYPR